MKTLPLKLMQPFYKTSEITLYNGDCLKVMPEIEPQSFDAIICDLPYGTTACKWDSVIPFEPLWGQYKRLIKPNGAIVLFGSQPFTTDLIMSNRAWFKYQWIWDKVLVSSPAVARFQPMRAAEDICVFYQKACTYNPQMENLTKAEIKRIRHGRYFLKTGESFGAGTTKIQTRQEVIETGAKKYPRNVIRINGVHSSDKEKSGHPTQKPIALLEYLIRTYTNEGDVILDNTCGSGTALVAARNTSRRAVGIEMDEGYCRIAAGRLGRFEPSEFEPSKKAVTGQLGLFEQVRHENQN